MGTLVGSVRKALVAGMLVAAANPFLNSLENIILEPEIIKKKSTFNSMIIRDANAESLLFNTNMLNGTNPITFEWTQNEEYEQPRSYILRCTFNENRRVLVAETMHEESKTTNRVTVQGLESDVTYTCDLSATSYTGEVSGPSESLMINYTSAGEIVTTFGDINGDGISYVKDLEKAYRVYYGLEHLDPRMIKNTLNHEGVTLAHLVSMENYVLEQMNAEGKKPRFGDADNSCAEEKNPKTNIECINYDDLSLLRAAKNGNLEALASIWPINLGFMRIPTDEAINYVWQHIQRYMLPTQLGDYNGDEIIDYKDYELIIGYMRGEIPKDQIWLANCFSSNPGREELEYVSEILDKDLPPDLGGEKEGFSLLKHYIPILVSINASRASPEEKEREIMIYLEKLSSIQVIEDKLDNIRSNCMPQNVGCDILIRDYRSHIKNLNDPELRMEYANKLEDLL